MFITRRELARTVNVMMARAKRMDTLMFKVNKLFSVFRCGGFLKKEKTCSPFFYRVIEALVKVGEYSKKLWKHSPKARVPKAFLVLPNFHPCFYNSTERVFYFFLRNLEPELGDSPLDSKYSLVGDKVLD